MVYIYHIGPEKSSFLPAGCSVLFGLGPTEVGEQVGDDHAVRTGELTLDPVVEEVEERALIATAQDRADLGELVVGELDPEERGDEIANPGLAGLLCEPRRDGAAAFAGEYGSGRLALSPASLARAPSWRLT